ncbi:MAG: hypothetical protein J5I98_14510 [Phaeodactylibacter sp.]|nr:hypothetical protein [Phaeodactylibacter sp.]
MKIAAEQAGHPLVSRGLIMGFQGTHHDHIRPEIGYAADIVVGLRAEVAVRTLGPHGGFQPEKRLFDPIAILQDISQIGEASRSTFVPSPQEKNRQ